MSQREEEILARELGKVGALGGWLGSKLGGEGSVGGFAAKLGGSMGASIACRFLPTEHCHIEVTLFGAAAAVISKVCSTFLAQGRIASDQEAGTSTYPKISGVVGSGFLNLNPTLVHVEVIATDNKSTTLLVSAAAKEGLIKQHTAKKAAQRIANALQASG